MARKKRFAEAKAQRDKEDARRQEEARQKLLAEEERKRKREEEARLRKIEQARLQKLLDDKVEFRRQQSLRDCPAELGAQLRKACAMKDWEETQAICIEWEGHSVLDEKDQDGWGPAEWACKAGSLPCLESLFATWIIEHDTAKNNKKAVSSRIDAPDDSGMTLLMFAAIANADDCIRFLISKGAKRDLSNEDGLSAYLWAAKCGNLKALTVLEELHCNQSGLTRGGLSALACAEVGVGRRGTGKKGRDETVAYLRMKREEMLGEMEEDA